MLLREGFSSGFIVLPVPECESRESINTFSIGAISTVIVNQLRSPFSVAASQPTWDDSDASVRRARKLGRSDRDSEALQARAMIACDPTKLLQSLDTVFSAPSIHSANESKKQ